MNSLVFNNLKRNAVVSNNKFTYSDLHLDLTFDIKKRDLVLDYDIESIKNSINNIFNTMPGERPLFPTFGCNLYKYLFDPVTQLRGEMIGRTILNAIQQWEPRVTIQNVQVVGYPEATSTNPGFGNAYVVNFTLVFPTLKHATKLTGIITQNGYQWSP
jgi:phage baseplate assembly protein W